MQDNLDTLLADVPEATPAENAPEAEVTTNPNEGQGQQDPNEQFPNQAQHNKAFAEMRIAAKEAKERENKYAQALAAAGIDVNNLDEFMKAQEQKKLEETSKETKIPVQFLESQQQLENQIKQLRETQEATERQQATTRVANELSRLAGVYNFDRAGAQDFLMKAQSMGIDYMSGNIPLENIYLLVNPEAARQQALGQDFGKQNSSILNAQNNQRNQHKGGLDQLLSDAAFKK